VPNISPAPGPILTTSCNPSLCPCYWSAWLCLPWASVPLHLCGTAPLFLGLWSPCLQSRQYRGLPTLSLSHALSTLPDGLHCYRVLAQPH
jgi:hypothetical protein